MRILYSFPDQLGGPGINQTAWQQVTNLVDLGADVTVFCTTVRDPLPPGTRVVETLRFAGRRVPHRSIGRRRAMRHHDRRVATALQKGPGDFDVVHVWPLATLHTVEAARRSRVVSLRELPNAHTAQTMEDSARACREIGVELPERASHRIDLGKLAIEEREFAEADFLLAPSEHVVESFVSRGHSPHRLLRHRYGFDPRRFGPPDPSARQGRPFTAIFVGRGEPPKGLHIALQAWQRSGITGRFVILGRIFPAYQEAMRDDLARPDVEWHGFVDDVPSRLQHADVLLLPTYTEGSALVVYEAMGSGTVPLVTHAAGAPATDGFDALIHPVGDVDVLAGHLRMLADTPDRLETLRAHDLAQRENLTWRAGTEALLGCYRTALDRGPTQSR